MYYYLNGTLALLRGTHAAIDCGGVCYRVKVSMQTYSALAPLVGKTAKVYTYLSVRDDAMELFGFFSENERDAFTRLITVSGVGPKAALGILSAFTSERLAQYISAGDAKSITAAPGIGLKTAQKIILELKGKFDMSAQQDDELQTGTAGALSEAINTLAVLGYSRSEALEVLRTVDQTMPIEDMVREALRKIAKKN
ncbi:MAG TPA: Holliday junction branch migration protein RuvA [Bacillota bacterium]|nr:Holliday junction branch migration protein RuvA [Bacillota bacterium]